jgi:MarR family transcriptional regulator, organic hydroperoxide resistance regulator
MLKQMATPSKAEREMVESIKAQADFARRRPPEEWLAGEVGRTDPGSEAWSLIHWLMVNNKHRFVAIGQEFELAPQQVLTIRILGGGARPMGDLAKMLACDSSNVTGITDRLEERGLLQRTSAEHDRRVKMLVLTDDGEKLRAEITKRLAEPPPEIASLSEKDQRALRDILRRAIEGRERD